jgi:hypothetical protein
MIMHTFADWGSTGQNMAESLGITTVLTTKAHGWNRNKGKGVGEILSSNGLLSDGTHTKI